MIYIYEDFISETHLIEKWKCFLSKERIEKMNRYKFKKDKLLCMMAFMLLRYSLCVDYGIKEMPKIELLENKKPFLSNMDVSFNISHCNDGVICAVDLKNVGVDIQNYNEKIISLSDKILNPNEKISNINYKQITRIWTLKESYGKYYGYGLRYNFREKDFSNIKDSEHWQDYENIKAYSRAYEKYCASVFSENKMKINMVSKEDMSKFIKNVIEIY